MAYPTKLWLGPLLIAAVSFACGSARKPCGEIDGPTVRLDLAFGLCNLPPQPSIRGPASVPKRTDATFDGLGSTDPNGDSLEFTWTVAVAPKGSVAELETPSEHATRFKPDLVGPYVIELRASDGELEATASEAFMATNRAPVARAGDDLSVAQGLSVTLDGTGSSDEDGDPLTYAWTVVQRPNGSVAELVDATSTRPAFTPDVRGTYEIGLRVQDGTVESAIDTLRVSMGISANPPVADAGSPQSVYTGARVALDGSGSRDPDGDALQYVWSITSSPNGSSAQLSNDRAVAASFVPDLEGDYVIQLVVDDGYYQSTADTVTISAEIDPILRPFGMLDPRKVYGVGTLIPGTAGRDLLCDLMDPNHPAAGFAPGDTALTGYIGPDGKLLYLHHLGTDLADVRKMVYDEVHLDETGWLYPDDPANNDLVVTSAQCPDGIEHFQVQPATGALVYTCFGSLIWYDEQGLEVRGCSRGFGFDGSVLCTYFVLDAAGEAHGIPDRLSFNASRAHPQGGFWTLAYDASSRRIERWRVSGSGALQLEVTYAATPQEFNGFDSDLRPTLNAFDGEGNLYKLIQCDQTLATCIARYDAAASTFEIVYDERTNPLCKLSYGGLISGP